jgi:hypothetical protein
MDTVQFSYGKRAIFLKVKEIKRLRGGVAVYAEQASARIDAEIGGKGRFRMKTNCVPTFSSVRTASPWLWFNRTIKEKQNV